MHTVTNEQIVPSRRDFTESLGNDTLEVAPGDIITVTYEDDVTSSGKARAIERKLNTMFSNGHVTFLNESVRELSNGDLQTTYSTSYRVSPGDVVVVMVEEPDLNVTAGSDSVEVYVSTTSGDRIKVVAKERLAITQDGREVVAENSHGRFYARLRTRSQPYGPNEKRPDDMLVLARGDSITATYKDEDNTTPGVPCMRKATLISVPEGAGVDLRLSHTGTKRISDRSPEGIVRLKAVRRRGNELATTTWRDNGSAKPVLKDGEVAIVTPRRNLPVEVVAPAFAKHSESTVRIEATSRSELQLAEAEQRQPNWNEYTLKLMNSWHMRRQNKPPYVFTGAI
jgi:hypothetical protein